MLAVGSVIFMSSLPHSSKSTKKNCTRQKRNQTDGESTRVAAAKAQWSKWWDRESEKKAGQLNKAKILILIQFHEPSIHPSLLEQGCTGYRQGYVCPYGYLLHANLLFHPKKIGDVDQIRIVRKKWGQPTKPRNNGYSLVWLSLLDTFLPHFSSFLPPSMFHQRNFPRWKKNKNKKKTALSVQWFQETLKPSAASGCTLRQQLYLWVGFIIISSTFSPTFATRRLNYILFCPLHTTNNIDSSIFAH